MPRNSGHLAAAVLVGTIRMCSTLYAEARSSREIPQTPDTQSTGKLLSWKFRLIGLIASVFSTPVSAEPGSIAARRAAFLRKSRPGLIIGHPAVMADVREDNIAGVPVRRYTPCGVRPGTLVFFHGGGFVAGGLDSHDILVRALAVGTRRRVVAVDYRLTPEHPYPAAVEDCRTVALAIAAEADAGPIAVCGDSAGGNLAAVVVNECVAGGPGWTPVSIRAQVRAPGFCAISELPPNPLPHTNRSLYTLSST